jgi:hypothetical protein
MGEEKQNRPRKAVRNDKFLGYLKSVIPNPALSVEESAGSLHVVERKQQIPHKKLFGMATKNKPH